jgi:cytochrome c oxidase cbb3-type subunit 3
VAAEPAKSPDEDRVVHTYDGIEEYDNRLPRWWLATLYGAMVFALVYWFHYEVLHTGPSIAESYERSVVADRRAAADRARRAGAMTDEALVLFSRDPITVRGGRGVFAQNCVACHAANGGGGIGPNLTDGAWLHGARPTEILRTVNEGVLTKGMPAWGPQLGLDRVQSVVAYVLTLRDTNVPGGKAPQAAALARE